MWQVITDTTATILLKGRIEFLPYTRGTAIHAKCLGTLATFRVFTYTDNEYLLVPIVAVMYRPDRT